MEYEIKELPAVRVAYLRYKGPFGAPIGEFWKEVFTPWQKAFGLVNKVTYGVAQDDPGTTPPEQCRYDACVTVPESFTATGSADITTLPGGRYAVGRFEGQPTAIADAWTWMTRNWLPSSGLPCDDRPCFEMFTPDLAFNPQTGAMTCDICIPVRPL